jgi:hypothetical protein
VPDQALPNPSRPGEAGRTQFHLRKLQQARARLSDVQRVLAAASTPNEIGGCAPLLEEAILALQAIPSLLDRPWVGGPDHAVESGAVETGAEVAREFAELQFELGVVRRLIEGGADFYRGWARALAAVLTGYTPSGEPAALTAQGSVSLEG